MTRPRFLMCAACAILALGGCDGSIEPMVIHGASILDGTGAPALANGEMVVVDGRIACIAETGVCERPESYDDVDAAGFWILPGLIDTHVHTFFDGDPDRSWRDERLRFLLGVTTTREGSTAGNHEGNIAAGVGAADPRLPVPRLFVAGRVTGDAVADPAAAAAQVRRLAASGASSIKIKEELPAAVLESVTAAAHELDLPVWGHAWVDEPVRSLVREAVAGGYDGLAHLTGIAPLLVKDSVLAAPPGEPGGPVRRIWRKTLWASADTTVLDALARELVADGVWLEPLLVVEEQWAEPYGLPPGLHRLAELPIVVRQIGEPPGMPERSEADLARLRASVENMRRFVRTFHDAGGVVVTGTDGALAPGLSLHEEIKALVRAGFSNEDALAAATSAAADALGAADSLGTLETGKLADFIVLEGDPLADIHNIELVSRVAKGGVLHDPSSLFDQLKDDLGANAIPASRRLLIGLVALLAVVAATAVAVVRDSRRRPPRG